VCVVFDRASAQTLAMKRTTSGSDLEAAKKLVAASGNSFHTTVLRVLQSAGWTVRVSPYYSDSESGKAREVDLLAELAIHVTDPFDAPAMLYVRLFIECKFVNAPSVFWMHAQDRGSTFDLLESRFGLSRTTIFAQQHHYLRDGKIAKLFASGKATDTDRDPIYKAMNQSLNALIALRSNAPITRVNAAGTTDDVVVNYPVIVCNSFDKVFAVDMEADSDLVRVADEFLLEVNYAFSNTSGRSVSEFFLIDVVPLDRLHSLLDKIRGDVDAMREPVLGAANRNAPMPVR
jgi:hypothetical protein